MTTTDTTTLTASDLTYLRELVRQRSAIVIDESKSYLLESRLAPVARRNGLGSLTELVARLRTQRSGPLHDLVVDAMTTNETSFFRDLHPWTALEKVWIPELVQKRAAQRTLTFWNAACSSGQEPYSLAMMLRDRFPHIVDSWNIRIIATDLSAEMLGRSAAGRYTQLEVNRGLPAPLLVKHFRRDGQYWQIREQLRGMVEFRSLNLVSTWPFVPQVDVIFLRNVLIYFDLPTKQQILGKVREVLRPDGLLMLGTAETTLNVDDRFERITVDRATAYRPR
ncbi:CheR family methyltransferase [Egicoccus halophilus]|uniref:protein-glutamate O-methyltransferase n=1 Tax=Egicoccus halophilus TaxID=1670830 RepID=A0A8J3AC59_9ACTN|nr:protein-glutamate O-methyltransferase CheR [Egicoccus halophilus]GGI08130.1 chemotaxis protein methyltransferase [Egicoccus halophilus]